ncbi:MAG: hypothetical protein MJY72_07950, partial [Bacteroidales bacterium]|nr:hypothetical protein [Bacteroidales bacterium]
VRVVADENGTVRQVNQYYPYGELIEDANMAEGTSSDNRYRFTGKELATETGLYDFCARYLETSMGRFTTIDPLAEKYPSISPYAYCAGDPVNRVDPDGRKIVFAKGVSKQFMSRFEQTVLFMNSCGTSYNMAAVQASERVYYVDDISNAPLDEHGNRRESSFSFVQKDGSGGTIYWNPYLVVFNQGTGVSWSPSTSLAHEFGHLNRYDKAADKGDEYLAAYIMMMLAIGSDDQYDTKEEMVTITQTEQYAARQHGEVGDDQQTRYNHQGKPVLPPVNGWASMTPQEISLYIYEQLNFN